MTNKDPIYLVEIKNVRTVGAYHTLREAVDCVVVSAARGEGSVNYSMYGSPSFEGPRIVRLDGAQKEVLDTQNHIDARLAGVGILG